jgi:hypothetical protein
VVWSFGATATLADLPADYEHPAFPQPPDRNASIWRYIDIDKFESMVRDRALYMARADRLGDEHEGTTPPAELELWRRVAEQTGDEHERLTIEHHSLQRSEYAAAFRNTYYVSCWHMAADENVAMWDRYVRTPDSVAVRTTYSALRDQFSPAIVNIGMVRYIDYDREPLPSINMLQRITHKRHFFADEREVRAVVCALLPEDVRNVHVDPYLTSDARGLKLPVHMQRLVQGVVLNPKSSSTFKDQVTNLCAANGLPVPQFSRMARPPVP